MRTLYYSNNNIQPLPFLGGMHLLVLLAILTVHCSAQTVICQDRRYGLRSPAKEFCYLYYQISEDFSAANRSCVRDGANLLSIDDSSEDVYVNQTFFLSQREVEFWIGLNDLDNEGNFRWLNGSMSIVPSYLNWAGGFPYDNSNPLDCVKYSMDGWRVHSGYCSTSRLPHVCKMPSCSSLDGINCIGSEPITIISSVDPIMIIVPIVVVLIIIMVIVIILLVMLALWKFNNDAFQSYCCCCCLFTGSKSTVHTIQQENQRLRHELLQHKVSISGHFQSGQLYGRELSGVPDGKGGVLPTIIKQTTESNLSPTSRTLGIPTSSLDNIQPPLVLQRPSQIHRKPLKDSTSFYFGSPTSRDHPIRQSLPATFGVGQVNSIGGRPSIAAPIRGGTTYSVVKSKNSDDSANSSESDYESDSGETSQ